MAALLVALSAIYLMVGDLFISSGHLVHVRTKLGWIDLYANTRLLAAIYRAGLAVSGASYKFY
ncbi:hypothetical protein O9929_17335 [Vibrio lentus]|nr:hypothetical protein [Vibrio lentus]